MDRKHRRGWANVTLSIFRNSSVRRCARICNHRLPGCCRGCQGRRGCTLHLQRWLTFCWLENWWPGVTAAQAILQPVRGYSASVVNKTATVLLREVMLGGWKKRGSVWSRVEIPQDLPIKVLQSPSMIWTWSQEQTSIPPQTSMLKCVNFIFNIFPLSTWRSSVFNKFLG